MTCKKCEGDLSNIKYDWVNRDMEGENLIVLGRCINCNQLYKESYQYLGYEKVEAEK